MSLFSFVNRVVGHSLGFLSGIHPSTGAFPFKAGIFSGGIRRSIFGGLVGAGVGMMNTDSNSSNDFFRNMVLGGLIGGGIGMATTRGLWRAIPKPSGKLVSNILRSGISVSASLASGAIKALGVVGTYPTSSMLLGGLGLGMYGLMSSGAGDRLYSNDEAASLAMAYGGPSTGFMPGMGSSHRQDSRAMFLDSTNGLVLGLHRNRHS